MITLTNFLFVHGSFTLIKCSFHPCNWCIPSAHFPRNLSLMHRKCEWKFRLRSRARCKPRCVYRRGAMTAIHQLPEKKNSFHPSILEWKVFPRFDLTDFSSRKIYSQSSRNNGSLKLLSRLNTQSAIILHYNFALSRSNIGGIVIIGRNVPIVSDVHDEVWNCALKSQVIDRFLSKIHNLLFKCFFFIENVKQ